MDNKITKLNLKLYKILNFLFKINIIYNTDKNTYIKKKKKKKKFSFHK